VIFRLNSRSGRIFKPVTTRTGRPMDQILPRDLKFNRFEVDQMRGCMRVGERNIDLRPKAFDVLRYLAENAGRLVSKGELHDAVWGNVAVSDDSLVQCIRELRRELGDVDHKLIKTVPRRGYLLDVEKPAAQVAREHPDALVTVPAGSVVPRSFDMRFSFGKGFRWAAALGAVLIAITAVFSLSRAGLVAPAPHDLVSDVDAKRVAELAAEKQLPIPPFNIGAPPADVPNTLRRFVGVWVSDDGWLYSHRQFMVIVTSVNRDGEVSGYFVNGPTTPQSRVQGPALTARFTGHIKDGTLRYDGRQGLHFASLTTGGQMHFQLLFKEGGTGVVTLRPVWTLPKDSPVKTAQRAGSLVR
jgi:DNA-binding winged helix-turn-helix (wHTH) protein